MARKTATYVVPETGERDKGKAFVLTEMSAWDAEKWAYGAFHALAVNGIEVPPGFAAAGMAGIAVMSLKALQRTNLPDVISLLDRLMGCVSIMPDLTIPAVTRPLIESDIDEVKTLMILKAEVFKLHTGFSLTDALSSSILASVRKPSTESSEITPTSSEQLAQ